MVNRGKHSPPKVEIKRQALTEIARSQGGFFTASQAAALCFGNANQFLFVRDGRWERVRRGIFRLASEPLGDFDDLHPLALFFRHRDETPSGVFGLETAASIHGIGDFMPAKVSVLRTSLFRSKATIPSNVEVLRVADINTQVEWVRGLPVTSPIRTIVDLLEAPERDSEEIRRAFWMARRDGLISPDSIEKLSSWAQQKTAIIIAEWEQQLNSSKRENVV